MCRQRFQWTIRVKMAWAGGFVELLQHARHHHALVDDGPARERGEVDLLALGLLRVVVDDVPLGGAAHLVVSCSFMEFESRIVRVHVTQQS